MTKHEDGATLNGVALSDLLAAAGRVSQLADKAELFEFPVLSRDDGKMLRTVLDAMGRYRLALSIAGHDPDALPHYVDGG